MVGTMIREDTTSRIYTVALRYLIGFFTSTDTYPPFGVPVAGAASIATELALTMLAHAVEANWEGFCRGVTHSF